jgi:hypothetical protein
MERETEERQNDQFRSLQLGVLRLGFFQDGDVGVGVFPEGCWLRLPHGLDSCRRTTSES